MKILFLIISIFISGCASVPMIYNPNNLNTTELVKVTTLQKASMFDAGYNTWIEFVWDKNNEEITKRKPLWDNKIGEMYLPSGSYKFRVSCVNGQREANPEAVFELMSNKKYQIYCDIKKGKNMFKMTIDAYANLKIKEIE